MIYRDFQNEKLSALGLGTMRLPTLGSNNEIDVEKTKEMVAYAMEKGINYFDTAYGYHGGNSEPVMGEVLSAYPRDSYYLASKFPGYDLANMDKVEEIFEAQLKRCRTEYFDFYLFHCLCEMNVGPYLDEKNGIVAYLLEQKTRGRNRHLGVSTHAPPETTCRFLDALDGHIEFCQIQLNWLDWEFQEAGRVVSILRERSIPVWVMEPLRGGSLVNLAPKHGERLATLAPERSLPEWGFRFLQGIEGVTMVLSGMSNEQQLRENIAIFSEEKPLSESERDALLSIGYEMTHEKSLPCTACRYCTDYCPQGLDIPHLISLYNEHIYSGGNFMASYTLRGFSKDKWPSACIACRACEGVCPQGIKISEMMADFSRRLEKKK